MRILIEGIKLAGIDLIECHNDVWHGINDKSQISGITNKLRSIFYWLFSYPRLLWRYLQLPAHDLVLISYPGIIDIFVIRLFAWFRQTPVVWDVFISMYDTVIEDRRIINATHPFARILYILEWLALRAANSLFIDTQAHADRIETLFKLSPGTCGRVWVGVEATKFPQNRSDPITINHDPNNSLLVLFYGQFIPLHGITTIIQAAKILRDENINFMLIGKGQEAPHIRSILEQEPLPRLRWIDWVDYSELIKWIHKADICLGIFGTSKKAASVIPNKVFQVVASGKPIITRDSPAIRELLNNNPPYAYLIPPASPTALANAIRQHQARLKSIDDNERENILAHHIDAVAIGKQFHELMLTKFSIGHQ